VKVKTISGKFHHAMKILHLSDIHMGSGFGHGKIDPETGFNTRLLDFVKSLTLTIDRAISEPVDLVLFGGDAFPDATPAPYIQQAFASQFRRLVDVGIPVVLLVGNHDQYSQGQGGTSLSIYNTLGVPGVIVGDKPNLHQINTTNGQIQILTLPWLNRASLLAKSETENLSLVDVGKLLLAKLEPVLESYIRQLDPNLPTILLGHLMADNAALGAERLLAVGKGFTIPVSMLNRACFNYVALGHVHRHQNLNKTNNPPIVYPGSIDRVDFSEEKEEKGYVLISIFPNEDGKFQTEWEFCSLPVRAFRTIKLDVCESENPQTDLLNAIAAADITDAVVRLVYQLHSHQVELISTTDIHAALAQAHHYNIKAEPISQLTQPRIPELDATASDPLHALSTYLDRRPELKDIMPAMIAAAQDLLAPDEAMELLSIDPILNPDIPTSSTPENAIDDAPISGQLQLW
jgi:DNA repair protein SbcD/Mre11